MKHLVCLLLAAAPAWCGQVSVLYTANASTSSTIDFSFSLTGSFSAGDTLAIFFDEGIYTNLFLAAPGCSPDWCLNVFQPDTGLPLPGEFDLLAQNGHPTLAAPFPIAVDLLAGKSLTSPGFILYDSDFNILEQGTTLSGVPEPCALALAGIGFAGLLLKRVQNRVTAL